PSPILRYILTMTTHMNNYMTGSHAAIASLKDQPTVTASSSASLAVNTPPEGGPPGGPRLRRRRPQ
ncbi:MAG: hypothetical protein Q8P38_02940, partial [Candidatus Nanopelagicales bacterium]|nr:hypothetical protein [Candidatus Nanopelagicales bacterium]